jgi:hypothetical protein
MLFGHDWRSLATVFEEVVELHIATVLWSGLHFVQWS